MEPSITCLPKKIMRGVLILVPWVLSYIASWRFFWWKTTWNPDEVFPQERFYPLSFLLVFNWFSTWYVICWFNLKLKADDLLFFPWYWHTWATSTDRGGRWSGDSEWGRNSHCPTNLTLHQPKPPHHTPHLKKTKLSLHFCPHHVVPPTWLAANAEC